MAWVSNGIQVLMRITTIKQGLMQGWLGMTSYLNEENPTSIKKGKTS